MRETNRRHFLKTGVVGFAATLICKNTVFAKTAPGSFSRPDVTCFYVESSGAATSFEGLQLGQDAAYGPEKSSELTSVLSELPVSSRLQTDAPQSPVENDLRLTVHKHQRASITAPRQLCEIGLRYADHSLTQILWRGNSVSLNASCREISCLCPALSQNELVFVQDRKIKNHQGSHFELESHGLKEKSVVLPKSPGIYLFVVHSDYNPDPPDLSNYRLIAPYPSARPDVRELVSYESKQPVSGFEYLIVSLEAEMTV